MRFIVNLLVALAIVSTGFAPVEAARIFKPGQLTLLRGVEPGVVVSGGGSCTWTSTGLLFDLNPADTSTLKQDIAGTSPVTIDGDPVGLAKNATLDGFDLTAMADTAVRPTHNTDGTLHWLTFASGENDVLRRIGNLGLYSGGAMTIEVAVRETTSQQSSIAGEGLSSDSNPYYDPLRHNAASPTNAYMTSRADGGTFELNAQSYYTNGFTTNTDITLIVTDSGSSITGYLDGATGTTTGYSRSTHANADRFWVGARIRVSTDSYFIGRIYRLRAFNRVLNSTEIANDTTCLKATQGR